MGVGDALLALLVGEALGLRALGSWLGARVAFVGMAGAGMAERAGEEEEGEEEGDSIHAILCVRNVFEKTYVFNT